MTESRACLQIWPADLGKAFGNVPGCTSGKGPVAGKAGACHAKAENQQSQIRYSAPG
jgi:hypothetical protein